jgi:hypothetical protein
MYVSCVCIYIVLYCTNIIFYYLYCIYKNYLIYDFFFNIYILYIYISLCFNGYISHSVFAQWVTLHLSPVHPHFHWAHHYPKMANQK